VYLESIQNLLSNALKYSSPTNCQNSFSIRLLTIKLCLVSDNGLGIDLKEHGKEIFGHTVFYKHPNAKVGLFLTKAQVEGMGGQ
jgi:sensor histidine kinase regulating citrate/malate metabolism